MVKNKRLCLLFFFIFILPVVSLGESIASAIQKDDYFSKRDLSGKWDAEKAAYTSFLSSRG